MAVSKTVMLTREDYDLAASLARVEGRLLNVVIGRAIRAYAQSGPGGATNASPGQDTTPNGGDS